MRILEIAGSGTVGTMDMGPVSNHICKIANYFSWLGHEVRVVDIRSTGTRDLLAHSVQLIEIYAPSRMAAASARGGTLGRALCIWVNEYRFVHGLASRLNLKGFDVMHVHELMPAFLLQRLYRMDCVYTSHTPTWCGKDGARYGLLLPHEKGVIENARLTIALGDYLKECVPKANIVTIPNGIDLADWPLINKEAARRRLGLPASDFIVLYVGRIAPIKGVDILIEALRSLLPQLTRLRAIIIGLPTKQLGTREVITPYAQRLMQESQGLPVDFPGFINNRSDKFKDYLAGADVFVLPSQFEPQGVVVLEALAMEKPVIGSNTGGIPQMINNSVGFVFPPGDSAELARRIKELYDDPDRLQTMGYRCRAHVEEHYTWEKIARHLAVVFAALNETGGSG